MEPISVKRQTSKEPRFPLGRRYLLFIIVLSLAIAGLLLLAFTYLPQPVHTIAVPCGSATLSTVGDCLVAFMNREKKMVMLFDWNDLDKTPNIIPVPESLFSAHRFPPMLTTYSAAYSAISKTVYLGGTDTNPGDTIIFTQDGGHKWTTLMKNEPAWYCVAMTCSHNSRYLAAFLLKDSIEYDTSNFSAVVVDSQTQTALVVHSENSTFSNAPYLSGTAISEDGQFLAMAGVSETNSLTIVDRGTQGSHILVHPSGAVWLQDPAFSSDSRFVYCGDSIGIVYEIESVTGRVVRQFNSSDSIFDAGKILTALAISPDMRWIAAGVGSSGEVFLWDRQSGNQEKTFKTHTVTIASMIFSSDSRLLATSDVRSSKVKIWQLPTPALESVEHQAREEDKRAK